MVEPSEAFWAFVSCPRTLDIQTEGDRDQINDSDTWSNTPSLTADASLALSQFKDSGCVRYPLVKDYRNSQYFMLVRTIITKFHPHWFSYLVIIRNNNCVDGQKLF